MLVEGRISGFQGEWAFLSNFYPAKVQYMGHTFPTVEHAYQAAKCNLIDDMVSFTNPNLAPGRAKAMGRRIRDVIPNWLAIRVKIMENLVRQKFQQEPLRSALLSTGDMDLVEENWWKDTFWGVCEGKGFNTLGKILMRVREEIRE